MPKSSLPRLMLSLICITSYPGLFSSLIWLWELGTFKRLLLPEPIFLSQREGYAVRGQGLAPAVPPADVALRRTCFFSLHVSHTGQQQSNSQARKLLREHQGRVPTGQGLQQVVFVYNQTQLLFLPQPFCKCFPGSQNHCIFKLSLTVAWTTEAQFLRATGSPRGLHPQGYYELQQGTVGSGEQIASDLHIGEQEKSF